MLLAVRCTALLLPREHLPSALMGESTKTVRSSYHRAHGKGETTALRIPFGCVVYFIPADTKGFPKGKFEGSGEAGVIAGYNLSPGYVWDGEYLCWSLKELANISMMAKAPTGTSEPARHPEDSTSKWQCLSLPS